MHQPSRPFPLSIRALLMLATLAACDTQAPVDDPANSAEPSAAEASTPAAPTVETPANDSPDAPRPKGTVKANTSWWPEQVDLQPIRRNEARRHDADGFDYPAQFAKLDLDAVKADIKATLTDSQDWWPADYGNYGPLFIRMAWHSAGTYRALDGRGGADGGQQRFEPLNSWPDNANLDKARRLLWPVKRKYGRSISWADLMILTGNVALESMGFETLGFAGGREDDWQADLVYWGPESKMLADERYHGERSLQNPLAAVQMGLIYVNPEGPNGNPDPHAAAYDIRDTFARMGMNDEETVALIAGGHTFGKAHGAHDPSKCLDAEPAAASVHAQGFGWHNKCGTGHGADTVTSGLEGAWTSAPAAWTHQFFANLYGFDWEKSKSPAGATQWKPTGDGGSGRVPDAHDPHKRHAPMMLTTDLSLKEDSTYGQISKKFLDDPEQFEQAFAHAWFKLTHRDLGPRTRYLGNDFPTEPMLWQDPLPERSHAIISDRDAKRLKADILASGPSQAQLIRVAWASASTYRDTDMRGGANGARVRLPPQADWAVNDPAEVAQVIEALEGVQASFNKSGNAQVSLADLIVLGGAAAIEQAAARGGHPTTVPVAAGRVDASAEQTDVVSFAYLEPKADAFRNYYTDDALRRPAGELIEKAALLGLTASEMTALIGGLRVLDANAGGSAHGVLTDRPGTLSNDFFVNLLDLSTTWTPSGNGFEGVGPDGKVRWTATEVDLVFGSNSELRAICELYAYDAAKFHADFIRAWTTVMQADRFDLHR